MALEINTGERTGELVTVDVRKYLTADKDRLVDEGDGDAAFLYCTPGMQVPRAEAEKFGLLGDAKAAKQTPNKARRASENK